MRRVAVRGTIGYENKLIQVGGRWAGARVRVIPVGGLVHVYYGDELIRALAIDPDVYDHPNRRKPRRPVR